MKAATLSQSTSRIPQPALYPLEGLTKTSTRKTAVLVGLCFLVATFTFAIGSALIHSHFSSGTSLTAPSPPASSFSPEPA